MSVLIGSARHDENGKYSGGKVGDQTQKFASDGLDHSGEISVQEFYKHSKGWYVLRCVNETKRKKIAEGMRVACNNRNIGYSQSSGSNGRLGIVNNGVWSTKATNADCSSTVRACLKYAGYSVSNFTTANEKSVICATKDFLPFEFVSLTKTPLVEGDILVTKTKGHTVVVIQVS